MACLRPFEEAEEDLEQILEIAEFSEGSSVGSKGFGVVVVQPEGGGVETLFIRFAGASDSTEIADELESLERIMIPGELEAIGQGLRRRVRDDVEEEIQAGISGGEKGGREVFSEA